ncbi:MAG: putative sugar nucleotidyl transferase [Planctomycetota bacterium]|jgi:UDP-N-acetylglucosamine diphosphorylase/glucosamine-1-phosphate N-acetyltransferase
MRSICIFEDGGHTGLLPLTHNRASYELRLGMYTLLDRILQQYPGRHSVAFFAREDIADILGERYPHPVNKLDPDADGYLFINGRALDLRPVPLEGEDEIGICKDTVVYARLNKKNYRTITPGLFLPETGKERRKAKETLPTSLPSIKVHDVEAGFVDYPWDIIKNNRAELEKDCGAFSRPGKKQGQALDGVHILNPQGVFLGKNATVKPGCVLDAGPGPIYIGEEVEIMPNSVITGPAYVGDGSTVMPGARLREGSNIGPGCKVGGEISNSILHSYSNKQHDGFMGDSYLGSWVNIGAGTVTSNLKNTYGTVKVRLNKGKKLVDTGMMFLGAVIGDHTKIGINSSLDAGTHISCHCTVAGGSPIPKYLPPFTWLADQGHQVYNMRKAFIVASTAMARRDKSMSAAEEELYRQLFARTTPERRGMKEVTTPLQ